MFAGFRFRVWRRRQDLVLGREYGALLPAYDETRLTSSPILGSSCIGILKRRASEIISSDPVRFGRKSWKEINFWSESDVEDVLQIVEWRFNFEIFPCFCSNWFNATEKKTWSSKPSFDSTSFLCSCFGTRNIRHLIVNFVILHPIKGWAQVSKMTRVTCHFEAFQISFFRKDFVGILHVSPRTGTEVKNPTALSISVFLFVYPWSTRPS